MKKVGIITVDYNGHTDTEDLLKSLKLLNVEDLEVFTVVVDNGSNESLPVSWKKKYGITLLSTGVNLGFAGGYNLGIKYALGRGADYILVINNDTLVKEKNLVSKLAEVLEARKTVGVVSPTIWFAPGYEYHKDRYTKRDEGKVIWYAGGWFDWANVEGKHRGIDEVDFGQYNQTEKIDFISGCCFMARAEVFREVGGFNEDFFAYFEDCDWMMRVEKSGWELFYCGESGIYHKVSRTAGIGSPVTDYLTTRNRLKFGFKYVSMRTRFALVRQAAKQFALGRKGQRWGIMDWLMGVGGLPNRWRKSVSGTTTYYTRASLVVVNYKTAELTLKLLESLVKKEKGFDRDIDEVVVLDNGSEDGVGELIAKKYPWVIFIQNVVNTGFSAGYNKAISATSGEYVWLLNSDIEFTGETLEKMIEFCKEKKDRVVVGNKLMLSDGSVQKSCFNLPTVSGAIWEYFFNRRGKFDFFAPEGEKPVQVEGLVMASFMIPRKLLLEVGYLSEETFIYYEDIEYCRRLKVLGIPVYYIPWLKLTHHHGVASSKSGKANENLVKAAKWYHGEGEYFALTWVLRIGQRWRKMFG